MYHAFKADGIRQLMGLTEADTPQALILHGTYDMPEKLAHWRTRLAKPRVAGKAFNVLVGEAEGRTLWYAPVLGAPMAAFVVHCACALGARRIIQIGSFGGTRKGLAVGDLLVVTEAGRGEAASDWYLPPGTPACADPGLTEALRVLLRARGLAWHEGTVFTTPAFMAEKWEDVLRWQAEGYAGVEMEAATTYAIAAHFGVPAACLLYLLDNLIEERAITHNTAEERARIVTSRALVEDISLALAADTEESA